jgi:hypothetical protein
MTGYIVIISGVVLSLIISIGCIIIALKLQKKRIQESKESEARLIQMEIDMMKHSPGSKVFTPEAKRYLARNEAFEKLVSPIQQKIDDLSFASTGLQQGKLHFHSTKPTKDSSGFFQVANSSKKHHFRYKQGKLEGDEVVQSLSHTISQIVDLIKQRDDAFREIVMKHPIYRGPDREAL